MKRNPTTAVHLSRPAFSSTQTFGLALTILSSALAHNLSAQAPCPAVRTFATGLLAPSKIIQSPRGNFIVAEGGPEIPNHGRVSIVDDRGQRRTLLDGLPSARTF